MKTTEVFVDRWEDKDVVYVYNALLFIHAKEEILPFTITWMNLQDIILSEISQTEKNKYCMSSLICGI